jgi:hypothetical protein
MNMERADFLSLLKREGFISDERQVLTKDIAAAGGPPGGGGFDDFERAADRIFLTDPDRAVALLSTAPFSLAASWTGRALPALLDDQAQMAGRSIRRVRDFSAVKGGMARRRAVLVEGRGCLCAGEDFYEALAMAMVAEKAALAWAASSFLGGGKRIGAADAAVMRLVYRFKYGRARSWKAK